MIIVHGDAIILPRFLQGIENITYDEAELRISSWSRAAHKLHRKHADKSNFHPAVTIHPGWKCKLCFVKSNVSALCLLHSSVPCQSAQRAAKTWNHHHLSTQCMHWNHRPRSERLQPPRKHQPEGSTHHTFVPLHHPPPKWLAGNDWKLWTAWKWSETCMPAGSPWRAQVKTKRYVHINALQMVLFMIPCKGIRTVASDLPTGSHPLPRPSSCPIAETCKSSVT